MSTFVPKYIFQVQVVQYRYSMMGNLELQSFAPLPFAAVH